MKIKCIDTWIGTPLFLSNHDKMYAALRLQSLIQYLMQ